MSERFTRRHLNVASRLGCETVGEFTPVLLRQVLIADQMRQIDVNNETLRLNGSLTAPLPHRPGSIPGLRNPGIADLFEVSDKGVTVNRNA